MHLLFKTSDMYIHTLIVLLYQVNFPNVDVNNKKSMVKFETFHKYFLLI